MSCSDTVPEQILKRNPSTVDKLTFLPGATKYKPSHSAAESLVQQINISLFLISEILTHGTFVGKLHILREC